MHLHSGQRTFATRFDNKFIYSKYRNLKNNVITQCLNYTLATVRKPGPLNGQQVQRPKALEGSNSVSVYRILQTLQGLRLSLKLVLGLNF